MEVDEPTYLKVNGPACTMTPMDVLTYTRIMYKHTKAQFLAATTPSPPIVLISSPQTSPELPSAVTKADPVVFDSGNLHLPPPTATSNASTTAANAGITATTMITATATVHDDQAAMDPPQSAVFSSIHAGRTSGPISALHQSLVSASAPASIPLRYSHSPSPLSSPAAQPLAALFDAATTATARTTTAVPPEDAHRRRSSAGLRKLSAGLAKLGLWRGGHHAAEHPQQHQHWHSQSDQQQQPHEADFGREGAARNGAREVNESGGFGPALAHLQCDCEICDWCRMRRGVLKRNGLCNVAVGGPVGLAGVAAGRRDTV